jgi:hypothetical protein
MQDINIEKSLLIKAGIVIIVAALALVLFYPRPRIATINETVELCERENPYYDAERECKNFIDYKYPSRGCQYSLVNEVRTDFGSCRDCLIECFG